jgi:hypothetical protein
MPQLKSKIALCALPLLLSACSTFSFAPPPVNLVNAMESQGSNRDFSQYCTPEEIEVNAQGQWESGGSNRILIQRDAQGALRLIENFLLYYRCSSHRAANGRQFFEVPAFAAVAGTATAAAFGAGADVITAGGASNAILNGAKGYYAPKEKAAIYDSALDAIICIKTEAVGIEAINLQQTSASEAVKADELQAADLARKAAKQNPLGVRAPAVAQEKVVTEDGKQAGVAIIAASNNSIPDGVTFTASRRYFELVSASLFSVERILAQRLREVGIFDPAGLVAEIDKLTEEVEEAEAKAKPEAMAKAELLSPRDMTIKATIVKTEISLAALKPKLEKCVVRAKL